MSSKPEPNPASAVVVSTDEAGQVLHFEFRGVVTPGLLKPQVDELEKLLPRLKAGFVLVTDLTALESMDLDCVPHITRTMDRCLAAGVKEVVRIIPDPQKDIGFKLLSLVHYRGKVRMMTYESIAEARNAGARVGSPASGDKNR